MKKLGITFALCAAGLFAGEWKGVVSDSHCGKAHSEASAKAEQCVTGCIKKGGEAVLVTGDQVIKLDADLAHEPFLVMRGGTHEDALRIRTDEWLREERVTPVPDLGAATA